MARHGENIRKRKDGRWEGRYKAFDEKKEKYVYRSVYGRDYRETKEKLSKARPGTVCHGTEKKEIEYKNRESSFENCGGILFSQAAEEWLSGIYDGKKYSTYIKYETIYRTHLAGTVGSCRLSPDSVREVREKIFDHLSAEMVSESLQKSIICVANQIISFANRNYSAGMLALEKPPAKTRPKAARVFSITEQARLFACVHEMIDNKSMIAVLLCLYAGLRLGELCALQWTDIDFEGMSLTVNRTVQRIAMPGQMTKTILLETAPKSESSKRTIPLTLELLKILSHLKEEQPYVFGEKKPLDPRTMQYQFKSLLKKAEIDNRNFHALRHTFATNCIENGMDVKALSELLGHSDIKITLNRYVHPTMDSKRKQICSLSDFYGQICGQAT